MSLNSLISEIRQATKDLETAPGDDLAQLKALLERRSALIGKLQVLAPGLAPGQVTGGQLAALRSALARGAFLSAVLRMKRLEAAAGLEASMRQRTVASCFARRPVVSRRMIDDCG